MTRDTTPSDPFYDAIVDLVEVVSRHDPEAVARWLLEWHDEALAEDDPTDETGPLAAAAAP